MSNLIFIGGIHGVGKRTICKSICEQTNHVHITASELIKWTEISKPENKKVENIPNTQDRLIRGLNQVLKKDESYLLDGHFCLFNSEGDVEKVPIDTFLKISPKLISVVTTNVALVKQRLEKRDNKTYKFDILKLMQDEEKRYGKEVALKLNVPFIEIKDENYDKLIELITNHN